MTNSFLIAARRSPIIPRHGAFKELAIHELAQPVIAAVLSDAQISSEDVGEIIVSNALGQGGNPARSVALAAGLPESVGGLSIDRQCVGGLDALLIADAMIRSGQHDIVIAGGVESYSRQPIRMRTFADGQPPVRYDQAPFTPWTDRDPEMAAAAHDLGESLGIGKSEQDLWAMDSHANAMTHPDLPEIVKVAGVTVDSFKRNLTEKHCARATSVHKGITTANMAVAADAAAFVVMVSERVVAEGNLEAVKFLGGKTLGGDPTLPGLAPVAAAQSLFEEFDLTSSRLTRVEIMEAFAVQAIACQRGAGIPKDITNLEGGALARGHPIGASGAILATRLFHGIAKTGGTGLAMIAAAGGLGTAALFEKT